MCFNRPADGVNRQQKQGQCSLRQDLCGGGPTGQTEPPNSAVRSSAVPAAVPAAGVTGAQLPDLRD